MSWAKGEQPAAIEEAKAPEGQVDDDGFEESKEEQPNTEAKEPQDDQIVEEKPAATTDDADKADGNGE